MKIQGDSKSRIKKFKKYKPDTLAIHGGQSPDEKTGSVMMPIHQTSTFAQKSPAVPFGEFEYSRTHNPTRRVLEDCIALLEGADYGLATASGMGAIDLVFSLLESGDEIICCDDVYGGTYRLITNVLNKRGLKAKFLNLKDLDLLQSEITEKTKMIWVETPTNPLLKVIDIKACAELAKKNNILLAVDNTFATPIFQTPLALGADLVIHSMTKYINGHSDVVAGAIMTLDDDLADKLYFNQNNLGHILSPFDSWLVLRAIKTLPVRMRAHQQNSLKIAEFLEQSKKIAEVIFPLSKSHPDFELAKTQMNGFGGMMSFKIKGGMKEVENFFSKIKVFTLAESLGGVESLTEHPATMTHASIPKEIREQIGITDSLIRVSVGIEDVEDLIKDLDGAL